MVPDLGTKLYVLSDKYTGDRKAYNFEISGPGLRLVVIYMSSVRIQNGTRISCLLVATETKSDEFIVRLSLCQAPRWSQVPTRVSHAVVFVFPTIWEPETGTGYARPVSCKRIKRNVWRPIRTHAGLSSSRYHVNTILVWELLTPSHGLLIKTSR